MHQVVVADLGRYVPRRREALRGVVVHRIEVSQEDARFADTPAEIIRFFAEHPVGVAATGGKMPYPVLIDPAGDVTQTVPLGLVTPHAKVHNPTTIGVACIGDFRRRPPTEAQRGAVIRVAAALLADLGLDGARLFGHDELPDGRGDPTKECPGAGMDVPRLRDEVTAALAAAAPLPFVW